MKKCAENTALQRQQHITFGWTCCTKKWHFNWLHKLVSQFGQLPLKIKPSKPSSLAISRGEKSLNFYKSFESASPLKLLLDHPLTSVHTTRHERLWSKFYHCICTLCALLPSSF